MKFSILQAVLAWQTSSAFRFTPCTKRAVGVNGRSYFISQSSPRKHLNLNGFSPELNHAIDLLQDLPSIALADSASAASSGGWWGAYLNIFKSGLLFVHDVIDAPLKSAGIQQTWGPAIALFTAGMLVPNWILCCCCSFVMQPFLHCPSVFSFHLSSFFRCESSSGSCFSATIQKCGVHEGFEANAKWN